MKINFFSWIKIWFKLRKSIKSMTQDDEVRLMKLLKIGLRALEKESRSTKEPEITSKTLIVLKMIQTIDGNNSEIEKIKTLLELNKKLTHKKKK